MTKKELLKRIELLEQRVLLLEAQRMQWGPMTLPYVPCPSRPWWTGDPLPSPPYEVTCNT